MKRNTYGFTLVELIVSVTLSLLLMMSVSLFVGSGMQDIFKQQKALENRADFNDFSKNVYNIFSLTQSGTQVGSGVLLKHNKYFSLGGYSYVGTGTGTGIYCDSNFESYETEHVFLKNFIPFQESTDVTFEDMFTGSAGTYTSYQKEHIIKNSSGDVVVGKGIFGDEFTEGATGTGIYLNSPTGLAYNGNILYISDTLNNRILYWDSINNTIHKLLDKNDGLNEPTGLLYISSEQSLYVANSGKGEILKYSSQTSPISEQKVNFTTTQDINNLKKIEIEFLPSTSSTPTPNTQSDFTFSNINQYTDYVETSGNKSIYWFSNFLSPISNLSGQLCGGNGITYYKELGNIVRETISGCSGTGNILKEQSDFYQNIGSGTEIEISIDNSFTATGSYYTKVEMIGDSTETYVSDYFTKGDDNIITANDNILEVFTGGLNYPTGIWNDSGITYNEFNPSSYTFTYDSEYDTILETPIESLEINTDDDLLTILGKYYRTYDCYNPDDNNVKSFLYKKNLR